MTTAEEYEAYRTSKTGPSQYTATDAVRDVLKDMPDGMCFHGYDLFSLVRNRMRVNGNMSQPYDGSVLRIFRRYASLYGVKLKDHNRSVYQKVAKYTQLELF